MGSLEVGTVVGETYEVTRLIGRGGMGEVWLARHRRLPGKQVAIKVLHLGGKQLSADGQARFRREAEVATRINHPNIVEVHDFNTLPDGAPYLVLEYLEGESLSSRLRHPIELDEVQRILRQVGSALQAAHQHGVIHRDLKPDNIFIVPEPMGAVVKVLDFGISKVVDSTTLHTQEAVLVGTPAYMSPEQALGNNKDVGPQSDVFALGAIAYEMLCGAKPFQSESVAQLLFKIAYEAHPPLASRNPRLPAEVVQAVERALIKDRTARYLEVGSFIEALTGSPLPVIRRTEEPPHLPSGVATPGMGDTDSVMMGKTAAPTPLSVPLRPPAAGGTDSLMLGKTAGPAPLSLPLGPPAAGDTDSPMLGKTAVPTPISARLRPSPPPAALRAPAAPPRSGQALRVGAGLLLLAGVAAVVGLQFAQPLEGPSVPGGAAELAAGRDAGSARRLAGVGLKLVVKGAPLSAGPGPQLALDGGAAPALAALAPELLDGGRLVEPQQLDGGAALAVEPVSGADGGARRAALAGPELVSGADGGARRAVVAGAEPVSGAEVGARRAAGAEPVSGAEVGARRAAGSEPVSGADAGARPRRAGAVTAEPEEAEGAPIAAAPVKRPLLPPAEELEQLEDLSRLVKEHRFKEAVEIVDRANRLQLSTVGLSYAAMLSTQANCGRKDQGAAQSRYRAITEPSHRTAAKSFCERYIDIALLSL